MRGENFKHSEQEQDSTKPTRRGFLKALGILGAGAALGSEAEGKPKQPEADSSDLEKQIAEYGVTGKKLPMMLGGAVKIMPKGQELESGKIVFIKDLEKFYEKELPDDEQLRRLYKSATGLVLHDKYPIYINGTHPRVQEALKDPHAMEIFVAILMHEKYHVTNPDAPHSENYRIQVEHLDESVKKGKIPPIYASAIEDVRKSYKATLERESKSKPFVVVTEISKK
jgi:hypothetical protein